MVPTTDSLWPWDCGARDGVDVQRGLGARAHIDVNGRNQLWMENTGRRSGARLGGEASGVRTQLSPHWIGLMWQQAAKVYSSPRWNTKTLWVLTLESINLKIFETTWVGIILHCCREEDRHCWALRWPEGFRTIC